MDIQAYIASGQLEAYWAGELSLEEMRAVDELAQQYPEVHQELEAIRAALQQYGSTQSRMTLPNPDAILHILAQTESQAPSSSPKESEAQKNSFLFSRTFQIAASLLLLVASVGVNIYQYTQNQLLNQQVNELATRESYLAQQYQVTRSIPEIVKNRTEILEDTRNLRIGLTSQNSEEPYKATVFMNSLTRDVFIHIEDLPEPPAGHQYQLWAIKDGVSLDAGIFDYHSEIQKLGPMYPEVEAFAVTLEVTGGSPIPNLEKLWVVGALPAQS